MARTLKIVGGGHDFSAYAEVVHIDVCSREDWCSDKVVLELDTTYSFGNRSFSRITVDLSGMLMTSCGETDFLHVIASDVPELRQIHLLFVDPNPECGNDRLYLFIGQHLVKSGLFHVEDLPLER